MKTFLAGMVLLTAAYASADERPRQAPRPPQAPPVRNEPAKSIKWYVDHDKAVEARIQLGRPVFILFTDPERCLPCRRLEAGALKDVRVVDKLAGYVCLRLVLDGDAKRAALAQHYGVQAIPTLMRFDKTGTRTANPVVGDVTAETILTLLDPR